MYPQIYDQRTYISVFDIQMLLNILKPQLFYPKKNRPA